MNLVERFDASPLLDSLTGCAIKSLATGWLGYFSASKRKIGWHNNGVSSVELCQKCLFGVSSPLLMTRHLVNEHSLGLKSMNGVCQTQFS